MTGRVSAPGTCLFTRYGHSLAGVTSAGISVSHQSWYFCYQTFSIFGHSFPQPLGTDLEQKILINWLCKKLEQGQQFMVVFYALSGC